MPLMFKLNGYFVVVVDSCLLYLFLVYCIDIYKVVRFLNQILSNISCRGVFYFVVSLSHLKIIRELCNVIQDIDDG